MSPTLISSGVYEDRLALRLHQIRRQAEAAIRDGRKLDPHLIHAMTTGDRKSRA